MTGFLSMKVFCGAALCALAAFCVPTIPPRADADAARAVLDDFHDAAACADEERYFDHFVPDGIFLGSDGEERWTVDQFRTWAKPHFEKESAWIFVSKERHLYVAADSMVAWFDEELDSIGYGRWRGSGVMRKVDGIWKITQYNLTVPIPNSCLRDVVRMIAAEGNADRESDGLTRIFVVRHAEKDTSGRDDDPGLTPIGWKRAARLARMLEPIDLDAVYATQYERTQQTVSPAAGSARLEPVVVDARSYEELARKLETEPRGHNVLVCGHSNTVPALLAELGVAESITIDDSDYDNLFIVTLRAGEEADLLHMHLGA